MKIANTNKGERKHGMKKGVISQLFLWLNIDFERRKEKGITCYCPFTISASHTNNNKNQNGTFQEHLENLLKRIT